MKKNIQIQRDIDVQSDKFDKFEVQIHKKYIKICACISTYKGLEDELKS